MFDTQRIRERLARLAAASTEPARFAPGIPIAAETLSSFEAAHGIALPEDYRTFLLEVGEGGAGPEYGLLPLGEALAARGATIYELRDDFAAPETIDDFVAFDVGGILPVAYDGCDYHRALVVTGSARGTIWWNVNDRPGWLPQVQAPTDAAGKPLKQRGNYAAYYAALLLPHNRERAQSFAAFYDAWLESEEIALGLAKPAPKAKPIAIAATQAATKKSAARNTAPKKKPTPKKSAPKKKPAVKKPVPKKKAAPKKSTPKKKPAARRGRR